ncbi:hypothetical protein R3P38DRAFT_2919543 [Favolaschia claudopus]|uniref:Uncharacterized protein n=1 Tax=Favolaschia claudopus TaxID=2862362 RepID=A0AAW0C2N9_9AGAR
MVPLILFSFSSLLFPFAAAHVAAWHKGMYCLNGTTPGHDDQDFNSIANPLFNLKKDDWWFHGLDHCNQFPPADGDFLELPANGEFTVELSVNRAFTTLSYGGMNTGDFPDGQNYPNGLGGQDCISAFNIHTQNETMASGSAFAISYRSDLSQVTPENLVVFTTLYHTPWKRIATYEVPDLPECPDGGCICAWGWVPNGCGEPNMYMQGFRCKVTGQPGKYAVAPAVPPTYCADNSADCTSGPRQMIYWNQAEGNNIDVSGNDARGFPKSPAYNAVLGFEEGAQHDIFSTNSAPTGPSGPSGKPSAAQGRPSSYWLQCTGLLLLLALA